MNFLKKKRNNDIKAFTKKRDEKLQNLDSSEIRSIKVESSSGFEKVRHLEER